ncbi:MAG: hypothetical protein QM630_06270 [Microbacterium sp.]
MMKKIRPTVAALALILATVLAPISAQAAEDALQQRVDEVLAEFPGGVQTGRGEITWDDGEVILTLVDVTAKAVGTCASGRFCAYTGTYMSGAKISFTNCSGTNSVAPLGSAVHSFANARSSGTVHAYNGSTSVGSTTAGTYKNTTATVTRLGC